MIHFTSDVPSAYMIERFCLRQFIIFVLDLENNIGQ